MFTVYIYCITTLLLTSTAKADLDATKDIGTSFKQWVNEKLTNVINDLHNAEKNLKNTVRKAVEDSKKELQTEYMNQLMEFHSHKENLEPECFETGLKQLAEFSAVVGPKLAMLNEENPFISFLDDPVDPQPGPPTTPAPPNCAMVAFQDLGLMVYKVAAYVSSILTGMDDIVNGYDLCASTALKKFTCIFTYIGTAVGDVYNVIKGAVVLVSEMIDLGVNMKNEIGRCLNPKKVEIQEHMKLALNRAQDCTRIQKDIKNPLN
ncbi:uncharacterized protein [Rhodnius prolixus]|uniref:uncharacterized protein n=1 Tax=Rhodnius prolixus TaxID=13249 RepID=UPI003D18DBD9